MVGVGAGIGIRGADSFAQSFLIGVFGKAQQRIKIDPLAVEIAIGH